MGASGELCDVVAGTGTTLTENVLGIDIDGIVVVEERVTGMTTILSDGRTPETAVLDIDSVVVEERVTGMTAMLSDGRTPETAVLDIAAEDIVEKKARVVDPLSVTLMLET